MPRPASRSISRPPPSGTKESTIDPLVTLGEILGTHGESLAPPQDVQLSTAREMADQSLSDLASTHDSSSIKKDNISYQSQLEQFQSLHDTIRDSDDQLAELEKRFEAFSGEIDSLASEMEVFQSRSVQIVERLDIRKKAESKLATAVRALIIPPPIVRQLVDGEISPQWRAALNYLVKCSDEIKAMQEKESNNANEGDESGDKGSGTNIEQSSGVESEQESSTEPSESSETSIPRAVKESQSQIKLLSYKVIERIRDFMTSRIRLLRTSGVNSQAVQRNLLEYKQLFDYLCTNHPKLGQDLCQAYINTMRWYYSSNFARYIKSLEKLPQHVIDRSALLGDDSGSSVAKRSGGGLFSLMSSASGNHNHHSQGPASFQSFANIGTRINIIESEDSSVMLASVAESSKTTRHYMETAYRSLNLALVDNGSVEFQFLTEFFGQSNEKTTEMFTEVFEPTLNHCHSFTKNHLIANSFDAYGILICIRLGQKLEFELQHRKVPALEDYLNLEFINLWPRFQAIMDAHCESLHRASTRSSSYSYAASAGSSSSESGTSTSVPHVITQKYAMLFAGILTLCPDESSTTEPVANSVVRLRNEFESFLTKTSSAISDSKSRERFLHHNYALVLTILSDLKGPLAQQQQEHFKLLTDAYQA